MPLDRNTVRIGLWPSPQMLEQAEKTCHVTGSQTHFAAWRKSWTTMTPECRAGPGKASTWRSWWPSRWRPSVPARRRRPGGSSSPPTAPRPCGPQPYTRAWCSKSQNTDTRMTWHFFNGNNYFLAPWPFRSEFWHCNDSDPGKNDLFLLRDSTLRLRFKTKRVRLVISKKIFLLIGSFLKSWLLFHLLLLLCFACSVQFFFLAS